MYLSSSWEEMSCSDYQASGLSDKGVVTEFQVLLDGYNRKEVHACKTELALH